MVHETVNDGGAGMKKIKYFFHGNEVEMGWNEANEEIAKLEADNGEYTIVDDGLPEPEPQLTDADRIAELESALEMLLSGVTE